VARRYGSGRTPGRNLATIFIPGVTDVREPRPLRSIYAGWERGDFSHGEWADPEIEWVLVEAPSPGTWHGLAGMAEGFRTWFSSSEDVHVYADKFRELDDERVAVLVHSTGRGKASGLEYPPELTRTAHLFHVRGGKVIKFVFYSDRDRALADLGLTPGGES
jgi:ketosteroid isomerase-like protein